MAKSDGIATVERASGAAAIDQRSFETGSVSPANRAGGPKPGDSAQIATFTLREIAATISLLVLGAISLLVGIGIFRPDDDPFDHS